MDNMHAIDISWFRLQRCMRATSYLLCVQHRTVAVVGSLRALPVGSTAFGLFMSISYVVCPRMGGSRSGSDCKHSGAKQPRAMWLNEVVLHDTPGT